MHYVLVKNDKIVKTKLPKTGILKDGSAVSGYHLLDDAVLKSEGWLPLIDDQPDFNPATHYLVEDGYEIFEDKVVKKYKIKQKSEQNLSNINRYKQRFEAVENALIELLTEV